MIVLERMNPQGRSMLEAKRSYTCESVWGQAAMPKTIENVSLSVGRSMPLRLDQRIQCSLRMSSSVLDLDVRNLVSLRSNLTEGRYLRQLWFLASVLS